MNKAASLYLDVLRLAAAVVVFIVHAHYLLPNGLPILWRLASFGGEAVIAFFVLSGFVIAHVVRTREDRATDYLASRFARLYSVVLPALLVTLLLDLAGAMLAPARYGSSLEEDAYGLLLSLIFANEIWFTSHQPLSNTPFWSLGYEFWYYMIYAAARYVPSRSGKAIAVTLLCAVCGPKILLLMPVWLLGVAAYVIVTRARITTLISALLALTTLAGLSILIATDAKSAWSAWTHAELGALAQALGPSAHFLYSYAFGLLATIHVVAMVSLAPSFGKLWHICERAVRAASAQTFAIYLLHYPILKFLVEATATVELGVLGAPLIITLALAFIAMLGTACDRSKPGMKRWFHVQLAKLTRMALYRPA